MEDLVKLAYDVSNFRKENCCKCYHGTILEPEYDYDAALKYLDLIGAGEVPPGVPLQAHAKTAEFIAKQNGHKGFWTVKQTTCPYKYCQLGE